MALTQEQIKAGYSTIPGQYDPVTGKPKSTLTPTQVSQGYSTIPGAYSPVSGQLITAAGLTNESPLNLSNIQAPPPKDATRAITDITNSASSYRQIIDQARKQQAELLKQPSADVSGAQAQLQTQYGVDTNFQQLQALAPEIADLNNKIANLDAREQADLAQLIGQPVSQGFSMGMEGRIKRQYAAERAGLAGMLGAKTAIAAMYQGNISTAQSIINSTINALTYDVQQKRQDMDKLYDFYGDFISSLEKKEQTELANARQDLLIEESNQREDYRYLLNLMIDNPQAGITPFDTPEEAATKIVANPKLTEATTAITEANGRRLLIDKQTGRVIKDLGEATTNSIYDMFTTLGTEPVEEETETTKESSVKWYNPFTWF